jgi:hypothetical protein
MGIAPLLQQEGAGQGDRAVSGFDADAEEVGKAASGNVSGMLIGIDGS